MENKDRKRLQISCGEAGVVIAAVGKTITALKLTGGEVDEIKQVAQRLHTEAGWPQEVVDAYIETELQATNGE